MEVVGTVPEFKLSSGSLLLLLTPHLEPGADLYKPQHLNISRQYPFDSEKAMRDPFDKVLAELGVYQHLQAMAPIQNTAVPVTNNNILETPCRVQGQDFQPNMSDNDRLKLALQFIKYIHPIGTTPPRAAKAIRPISLQVTSVQGSLQVQAEAILNHNPHLAISYPDQYRIPPSTIVGLQVEEQVWRSEKFALGTLLYELYTGEQIFLGLTNPEIRGRYHRRAATFPNLDSLPPFIQCLIYACWSAEFGRYLTLSRPVQYLEDHPVRFSLQVAGAVAGTAAFFAAPILGVVGFSPIGPVAGSIAAWWQASIGLVEAGSLFALCQSAAMGGTAAIGLATAGATGVDVVRAMSELHIDNPSNLRDAFIRKFRGG